MKYLKISFSIFICLIISRIIPHPPNFTSLIALSFYVPALLGVKYIISVFLSFVLTDIFLGLHNTVYFTWSSILIIGILAKYFATNIITRISGALVGAFIFFFITNLGVWLSGMYTYDFNGLLECFILAIPFFGYSLISTFIFSVGIEMVFKLKKIILAN